jgi:hypothetical protein
LKTKATLKDEEFDALISMLQAARKAAFSISFSPVEVYLDLAVDSLLRVQHLLDEGTFAQQKNPALKDTGQVDALGNSKIVKIYENPRLFWDPESSIELSSMIESLIGLKQGKPFGLFQCFASGKGG